MFRSARSSSFRSSKEKPNTYLHHLHTIPCPLPYKHTALSYNQAYLEFLPSITYNDSHTLSITMCRRIFCRGSLNGNNPRGHTPTLIVRCNNPFRNDHTFTETTAPGYANPQSGLCNACVNREARERGLIGPATPRRNQETQGSAVSRQAAQAGGRHGEGIPGERRPVHPATRPGASSSSAYPQASQAQPQRRQGQPASSFTGNQAAASTQTSGQQNHGSLSTSQRDCFEPPPPSALYAYLVPTRTTHPNANTSQSHQEVARNSDRAPCSDSAAANRTLPPLPGTHTQVRDADTQTYRLPPVNVAATTQPSQAPLPRIRTVSEEPFGVETAIQRRRRLRDEMEEQRRR